MNAARTGMASELRFSTAVLSQRDAERISGGAGETNGVTPSEIVETLMIVGKDWISRFQLKTFEQFWNVVGREKAAAVLVEIKAYRKAVWEEYKGWSWETRQSAWRYVWDFIK